MPRAAPVMAATWPVRLRGCLAIMTLRFKNVTEASPYLTGRQARVLGRDRLPAAGPLGRVQRGVRALEQRLGVLAQVVEDHARRRGLAVGRRLANAVDDLLRAAD